MRTAAPCTSPRRVPGVLTRCVPGVLPRLLAIAVLLCAAPLSAQNIDGSFPVTTFPGGLAYDPVDDTLWVADQGVDTIAQYTRAGELLQSFPAPIPPGSGSFGPSPIALGVHTGTGMLWVGDEAEYVYEFDPGTGQPTGVSWPTRPQIVDMSGLAVDSLSDTIWVSSDGRPRDVAEFTAAGVFLGSFPAGNLGSTDPDSLAYNVDRNLLYVGDCLDQKIIESTGLGGALQVWSLASLSVNPEGLALDAATGKIFVADSWDERIYELSGMIAATGFALSRFGPCPGGNTLAVENATPGGMVAFLYSFSTGSTPIPAGLPCAGTILDLDLSARVAGVATADAAGTASISGQIGPSACGAVYLQAVDVTSCETSNVLLMPG